MCDPLWHSIGNASNVLRGGVAASKYPGCCASLLNKLLAGCLDCKSLGCCELGGQMAEAAAQVRACDGQLRVDACVNAANALAAWAEVEQAEGGLQKAVELLNAAVEGYEPALQQEEDAAVRAGLSLASHLS